MALVTRNEREGFWKRGQFPDTAINGSTGSGAVVGVADPWGEGGVNAPFDQGKGWFLQRLGIGFHCFSILLDIGLGGRRDEWLVSGQHRWKAVERCITKSALFLYSHLGLPRLTLRCRCNVAICGAARYVVCDMAREP
jgi:hypothetical protein